MPKTSYERACELYECASSLATRLAQINGRIAAGSADPNLVTRKQAIINEMDVIRDEAKQLLVDLGEDQTP